MRRGLVDELGGDFNLQASAVIRQAYKLTLDEGFKVEGSAVERGAFHHTIHREDGVDGIDE
jgi:hypothetical protein